MLKVVTVNNKNRKQPSVKGNSLGIFSEQRVGQYGTYEAVLYDRNAQQFIIDNLDAVIHINNLKPSKSE